MNLLKILRENSGLVLKTFLVVLFIFGVSNIQSSYSYFPEKDQDLSSSNQKTKSEGKDIKLNIPNVDFRLFSKGLNEIVSNFGITVFAQPQIAGYVGTFKTKCGWLIGDIVGGENSPWPGDSIPERPSEFWRNTCQNMDGSGSFAPPACQSVTDGNVIDNGYSCYPTGIDMNSIVNGRVEEAGPGGEPGNGGAGLPGEGEQTVNWYFHSQHATVGVCERTCIWNDANL